MVFGFTYELWFHIIRVVIEFLLCHKEALTQRLIVHSYKHKCTPQNEGEMWNAIVAKKLPSHGNLTMWRANRSWYSQNSVVP